MREKAKVTKSARPSAIPNTPENDSFDPHGQNDNGSAPTPVAPRQRIYKGTQEVDHDLFKLTTSKMLKNVSYTDSPILEQFDHNHIFHTVDSNGKKQTVCTSVGGHTHECTVRLNAEGVPTIVVSKPCKWVKVKRKGKYVRELAPIILDHEDGTADEHTHEVEYLGSEKIKLRESNIEFAKFEASVKANQITSVEGVTG